MSDPPPDALASPSTARNRTVIREVLSAHLPPAGLVLEIAAGAGEHAVTNASAFPGLRWQPTDQEPAALASIEAWRRHAALPNLLPPLSLDARDPDTWPVDHADAIVAINMIHISPWSATRGLMTGAGRLLPSSGPLVLYGAFLEREVVTAPGNLAFHESLVARNPEWGLRQLEDVAVLAARHGLALAARIAVPANNLMIVFRRA